MSSGVLVRYDDFMVKLDDVRQAQARLRGVALHTPLLPAPPQPGAPRLFLKAENLQPVGAFKVRGAYNKIASLSGEERSRGVISYSSGNHAQGVAYAARALGVKAVIVMPRTAPKIKLDATAGYGAEIVLVGPSSHERKARAEELAQQHGYVIVPPYNDEAIIAGQGTIALEILQDMPDVELVLSPVGGGGLISGVAAAIKQLRPEIKVVGVEPELANDAQLSFRARKMVELSPEQTSRTAADGLRTQSVGEINLAHILQFVDNIVTVSEDEILKAMRLLALNAKLVVEPSGAVTVAAHLFRLGELPASRKSVAIISGGNVEPQLLSRLLGEAAVSAR
ncbi:MAG TPA: threonine/serine dehydratase [Terriglobales bacterium]|nr:threonine/serine dehydratase [Terriglobales bacterium]